MYVYQSRHFHPFRIGEFKFVSLLYIFISPLYHQPLHRLSSWLGVYSYRRWVLRHTVLAILRSYDPRYGIQLHRKVADTIMTRDVLDVMFHEQIRLRLLTKVFTNPFLHNAFVMTCTRPPSANLPLRRHFAQSSLFTHYSELSNHLTFAYSSGRPETWRSTASSTTRLRP